MCLIIHKPSGEELPKEEYIKTGSRKNSDGMGIAFNKKGEKKVTIKKDFNKVDELIEFINKNITKEDSMMIHFRLATSGYKDKGNRHPFPLSNNNKTLRKEFLETNIAVAHNGVIRQYGNDKELSDTGEFIKHILSQKPIKRNLFNDGIITLIEEFIGNDRLLFITNKGGYLRIGNWTEENGCFYSNDGYKDTNSWWKRNYSHYYNINDNEKFENKNNSCIENAPHRFDEVVVDQCENCGKRKNLLPETVENMDYFLCKTCRKKARKNKLTIDGVEEKIDSREEYNNRNDITIFGKLKCASCGGDTDEKEGHNIYGAYWLCTSCFMKIRPHPKTNIIGG